MYVEKVWGMGFSLAKRYSGRLHVIIGEKFVILWDNSSPFDRAHIDNINMGLREFKFTTTQIGHIRSALSPWHSISLIPGAPIPWREETV